MPAGPYRGQQFQWCAVELDRSRIPDRWGHWLLIRRQLEPDEGTRHRKLAFYRCAAPPDTATTELIRVAAARWRSEDCFQAARTLGGLSEYQVRGWRPWYAHTTLTLAAISSLLPSGSGMTKDVPPHGPQSRSR
jgi:SRSO17 transposase